MLVSLLITAAEGGQVQAREPDADDTPRPGWVSEPGFEILRVTMKEIDKLLFQFFNTVWKRNPLSQKLSLLKKRVWRVLVFNQRFVNYHLVCIPVLLSLTALVCPCLWPTGWTRARQDPYRQNWLWHSRHWRSALPYVFFNRSPCMLSISFLPSSCSQSHTSYSPDPSSHFVLHLFSFLCTHGFSLWSFIPTIHGLLFWYSFHTDRHSWFWQLYKMLVYSATDLSFMPAGRWLILQDFSSSGCRTSHTIQSIVWTLDAALPMLWHSSGSVNVILMGTVLSFSRLCKYIVFFCRPLMELTICPPLWALPPHWMRRWTGRCCWCCRDPAQNTWLRSSRAS